MDIICRAKQNMLTIFRRILLHNVTICSGECIQKSDLFKMVIACGCLTPAPCHRLRRFSQSNILVRNFALNSGISSKPAERKEPAKIFHLPDLHQIQLRTVLQRLRQLHLGDRLDSCQIRDRQAKLQHLVIGRRPSTRAGAWPSSCFRRVRSEFDRTTLMFSLGFRTHRGV